MSEGEQFTLASSGGNPDHILINEQMCPCCGRALKCAICGARMIAQSHFCLFPSKSVKFQDTIETK